MTGIVRQGLLVKQKRPSIPDCESDSRVSRDQGLYCSDALCTKTWGAKIDDLSNTIAITTWFAIAIQEFKFDMIVTNCGRRHVCD